MSSMAEPRDSWEYQMSVDDELLLSDLLCCDLPSAFNSTAPKVYSRIHKSPIFVFFPFQLSSLDYVS